MFKILSMLVCFVACFSGYLSAKTLTSTAIMRAAGPVEKPNGYKAGLIAVGKAMAGHNQELHWKAFVIFDVSQAKEELGQRSDISLRIAMDWIKDEEAVRDLHVYYVGTLSKANFTDQDMWQLFPRNKGVRVGSIQAEELVTLKQRQWFDIPLNGKIPSQNLDQAKRFMVFRIESGAKKTVQGNGIMGLSPELDQHSLILGREQKTHSPATGGY